MRWPLKTLSLCPNEKMRRHAKHILIGFSHILETEVEMGKITFIHQRDTITMEKNEKLYLEKRFSYIKNRDSSESRVILFFDEKLMKHSLSLNNFC
jgi:hypothetical protein